MQPVESQPSSPSYSESPPSQVDTDLVRKPPPDHDHDDWDDDDGDDDTDDLHDDNHDANHDDNDNA